MAQNTLFLVFFTANPAIKHYSLFRNDTWKCAQICQIFQFSQPWGLSVFGNAKKCKIEFITHSNIYISLFTVGYLSKYVLK